MATQSILMKYRKLSLEELEELKSEFINFLAVNGIAADDWQRIQKVDQAKHDEMVEDFRDMVMEKVLSNIKYLEYKTSNSIMLFACKEDKMALTSINIKEGTGVEFDDAKSIEILLSTDEVNDGTLSFFRTEKTYQKERTKEVFDLTEQGCMVVTEDYYNNLASFVK